MRAIHNPKLLGIMVLIVLILNIRLWGMNIWYRIYVHQVARNWYDKNKIPFIKKGPILPYDLHYDAIQLSALCCNLKTSYVSKNYGAFDSSAKGGAIYWHEMNRMFDSNAYLRQCALNVQNFAKQFAENEVGEKLYPFHNSMWNTFVLNYSGKDGSFSWHYDSEDVEDYRVLFCVRRTSTVGEVEYVCEQGEVKSLDLQAGQCYILRGSTTFHRVTNNGNERDSRVMLGFHFSKTPNKTTKNLCYFATLTAWKIAPSFRVWWNQNDY